ncbi:uncharacterized protein CBL_13442 [Carabus blaptoides fortunei]
MRRPIKRNKITEGIYGSTLLYLKFLLLWVLVILADFILEFRFEFLWPFYLLLRSVYDSFKYQGLAFSVFFVCIALTSDLICFFFIPVHWLFFAASTYVWVQYVWHTDKGICLPTILLWMLFVYLEAAIRLKDLRHMPFHMDLCRPFAAHCIGYPVVTLGFGFKSYVGYRMRQRKQRDVAKENEFYMQLLQQALPIDTSHQNSMNTCAVQVSSALHGASGSDVLPSSLVGVTGTAVSGSTAVTSSTTTSKQHNYHHTQQQQQQRSQNADKQQNNTTTTSSNSNSHLSNGFISNGSAVVSNSTRSNRKTSDKNSQKDSHTTDQQQQNQTQNNKDTSQDNKQSHKHSNGAAVQIQDEQTSTGTASETLHAESTNKTMVNSKRKERQREAEREAREMSDYLQRLEVESKKIKNELQQSRTSEVELKSQISGMTTTEKSLRSEISSLQHSNEDLQAKLHNVTTLRTNDRQTITNLERRLAEERRSRAQLETQLAQERKNRKQQEQQAAQQAAQLQQNSMQAHQTRECTDACRNRRKELELEVQELKTKARWAEDRCVQAEREAHNLVEQQHDTEILMAALAAMQDKNSHLENSLSAETRIKLDLFSALGEAKRLLEIRETVIRSHEKEIEELKGKIAQVLAVMPIDSIGSPAPSNSTMVSRYGSRSHQYRGVMKLVSRQYIMEI